VGISRVRLRSPCGAGIRGGIANVVWIGRLAVVLVRLAALNFLAAAGPRLILDRMALGRGGTSRSVNSTKVSVGKTTAKVQFENQAHCRISWRRPARSGRQLQTLAGLSTKLNLCAKIAELRCRSSPAQKNISHSWTPESRHLSSSSRPTRESTVKMAPANLPSIFNATSTDIEQLLAAQCHIGSKKCVVPGLIDGGLGAY
jgi:hypothetical protein